MGRRLAVFHDNRGTHFSILFIFEKESHYIVLID